MSNKSDMSKVRKGETPESNEATGGPRPDQPYPEHETDKYPDTRWQMGDRLDETQDQGKVKQPTGNEKNPGDKDGGKPMTPKEPGSAHR